MDQLGPGRDLGLGGGGIAVARHVDQRELRRRQRKKISSWVRPGVCEVRASALRPVSALIRLDLPTLERPAKAISMPCIGGSRCERAGGGGELPVAGEQLAAGFDLVGA